MNETPLVPAIDRAIALLSLFKNGRPDWSLAELARPHLLRLRDALGETAALGVYVDGHATLLEIAESRQMITISAPVGKRLPLDAGCFGKLYLAALDDAVLG